MDYFSGWCKSERRLDGYTAIVTGSNSGMGLEIAHDLYKRGARVIMACRNMEKAEAARAELQTRCAGQAGAGELLPEQLDLCSARSVRQFARRVTSRGERARLLVCNAGVMMCPQGRSEDGFETHIAANHLGHALLSLLLLPTLIQNAPSRVVFVSSRLNEFFKLDLDDINLEKTRYSPLQAYVNSKIANILFAKALDIKLKEHNIKGVNTYSLHPGIVKTDIGRYFPQTAWRIITYGFQNILLRWCWKSPRCGAQTSIYCAVDEKCEDESGFYYSDCAKTRPSKQCRSEEEARKLWDITIDMLKLQDYDPFTSDTSFALQDIKEENESENAL
nr:retinol dehydrogenase 11-like [Helicoverpa armigera]